MVVETLGDAPEDIKTLAEVWPLCFEFKLEGGNAVVAGSYRGKVMHLLKLLYPDTFVHGFDPQGWAILEASKRLHEAGLSRYSLANYGLGDSRGTFAMGEWFTDACSFVNMSREKNEGMMIEFGEAMESSKLDSIDLAVFNMEGYEFPLLLHILNTGWLPKISRLAVQWHLNIGAGGGFEMDSIINEISKTHTLVKDQRPQWTYHELSV